MKLAQPWLAIERALDREAPIFDRGAFPALAEPRLRGDVPALQVGDVRAVVKRI